jgi:integrase
MRQETGSAVGLGPIAIRGGLFLMAKSPLKLVTPTEVNRTVAPTRRPNAELRTREHLTPTEVEAVIEAATGNRHGHRDATMILLTFRHGLRAAEVCDLRWDQVDFNGAVLHVRRVKNGIPSTHPLVGDELRALRRLQRESPASPFVFVSERGSPFTTAGFARMIERVAASAGLELGANLPRLRAKSRTGLPVASTRPWRQTGSRTSGETEVLWYDPFAPRGIRNPRAHSFSIDGVPSTGLNRRFVIWC